MPLQCPAPVLELIFNARCPPQCLPHLLSPPSKHAQCPPSMPRSHLPCSVPHAYYNTHCPPLWPCAHITYQSQCPPSMSFVYLSFSVPTLNVPWPPFMIRIHFMSSVYFPYPAYSFNFPGRRSMLRPRLPGPVSTFFATWPPSEHLWLNFRALRPPSMHPVPAFQAQCSTPSSPPCGHPQCPWPNFLVALHPPSMHPVPAFQAQCLATFSAPCQTSCPSPNFHPVPAFQA
jgi:hypothetical protein